MTEAPNKLIQYFVDEAGDGTLFDGKGKVLVGQPGCSNFFMAGLADLPSPSDLAKELAALRHELLQDPLLRGVRAMRPERGQTALFFHAKDDPIEVRREVFRILLRTNITFSAVVRCKWTTLGYVRSRNQNDPLYRYNPNELYDHMVRRLFKQRLHLHEAYRVVFATRGNRERSAEFKAALTQARDSFVRERQLDTQSSLEVIPSRPEKEAGLQAVDYFLWALQRVYERPGEAGADRFLNALWDAGKVSMVWDLDDHRRAEYGVYYTRKKPLRAAALRPVEEYRTV